MPYVQRIAEGPLDGALIVVDTDLPIVSHCFAYRLPDGSLNLTITTDSSVLRDELADGLRALADSVASDPRAPH